MSCTAMAFFPANFMIQTTTAHDQDEHHHHHHHHQHHQHHQQQQPPTSLSTPILSQDFHGGGGGGGGGGVVIGKRSMSFSGVHDHQGGGGEDELSDDGSQIGEKKRRLNMEQVKTLEKNFELGNKLEPERKMQLARALGLQPRQIAIWFQNRRARWKTKQLEKDYEVLKRQFEAIKSENDALQAHNQKLHAEIMALKNRGEPTESINLNKETEGSSSNRSENSSDIKLDISRTPPAIDSHPITSRTFFPSSNNHNNNTNTTAGGHGTAPHQLFLQTPSTRTHHQHQDHNVKEESLCNMFCTIDDQTGFWPWLEQQHFN